MHFCSSLFLILLSEVSAFSVSSFQPLVGSLFYTFIGPKIEFFDSVWDDYYFDYQKFATISFAATCDWTRGSMLFKLAGSDRGFGKDSPLPEAWEETSCGETCKLLSEDFDGRLPQAVSIYSPSDHVSVTAFTKHTSTCTGNPTIGYQCRFGEPGSFFEGGISWFFTCRGTFAWDIVNMRRNQMVTMSLVSICAQCAATDGPYRNFVALRFSIARVLLKVRTSNKIPEAERENLCIIGTSMGGQLAQLTSAWLSAERSIISQGVYALITHGAPRLANRQLAAQIAAGVSVPYVQFVMYRDVVPHFPPMLFGFKTASRKIFWLYLEDWYWAKRAMGERPDHDGALRYKELVGAEADEEFASSLTFFNVNDHLLYYLKLDESGDLAACGGFEDKFFLNTKAVSLYDA